MKKMIKFGAAMVATIAAAGTVNAASPGYYVGAGLGSARLQTPDSYLFGTSGATTASTSRERGGLSGRVFAGYNFNQYLGLEMGLANYAHSVYKGSFNNLHSSIQDSMQALDLVGKAYYPFGESGFNVFGLAGLAEVANTVKYNNGGVPLASGVNAPSVGSHTYHSLRPKVGLGIGYDINSNVSTGLEFSHIQGKGNLKSSAKAIPSADMLAFTVSYNFS